MPPKKEQKEKKEKKKVKKGSWPDAVSQARKALGIEGFEPIKKGSKLYEKAMEIYKKE